jgi:hypothetical protein
VVAPPHEGGTPPHDHAAGAPQASGEARTSPVHVLKDLPAASQI